MGPPLRGEVRESLMCPCKECDPDSDPCCRTAGDCVPDALCGVLLLLKLKEMGCISQTATKMTGYLTLRLPS